ncbi:helix-turn-helix domain-containing protein [Arthrobacter sp. NEB 688]|uniref:PucR family transcriptional regulator n=1 Tax=Arthrobacter sp. NEB 688 TaxID=904039 RepID=UPI00156609CC|nr:helix-turn-helix domain-containing protein [Arthrobacter sp. NEB 688]QKE84496.1 PucR family transcriptional regulator [Arthrobacter sp. NEB 688]
MTSPPADPWPTVGDRVAELIRRGALAVSEPGATWIEDLHAASLGGETMAVIAADPALAESTRRANVAIVMGWVAANIERPGERVRPSLTPQMLSHSRDLVRRGLEEVVLDANRKGQSAAWRHWMQVCFGLTDDPSELSDLLQVTALSISTYVDDTMDAVRVRMQQERADLTTGTHAERLAAVTLLLEGAPLDPRAVEARLGYRLTGPHTAAVVWGPPDVSPGLLEAAAEALLDAAGGGRRLTVIANASTLWVWLPHALEDGPRPAVPDPVRVAVGRPAADRDGFRSSHLDAVEVQRTMSLATSRRRLAFHRDIALVGLLERDRQAADAFLEGTLGALRDADPELRSVALTYVRELCNVTRTAERLYTHRNTVLRRLQRVDELLPISLAQNSVHVGAALELLSWRDS